MKYVPLNEQWSGGRFFEGMSGNQEVRGGNYCSPSTQCPFFNSYANSDYHGRVWSEEVDCDLTDLEVQEIYNQRW